MVKFGENLPLNTVVIGKGSKMQLHQDMHTQQLSAAHLSSSSLPEYSGPICRPQPPRHPMEEVQAAVTAHLDQVSGLVQALSAELRRGIVPAADSLLAFVRAVDWTEPWLICLMAFHATLLLTAVGLRKNANFQLFMLFLAYSGVYLAEKINSYMAEHWKSIATRNYFDHAGVFVSVVWSGPLIFISMVIVVSSLIALCRLMVKWKRAELRHRAQLARAIM
uniref:Uncharacterized protein n=1 Tax=Oryza punctata TaxID=4537 RepID=A0A0E0L2X8_ORYPU